MLVQVKEAVAWLKKQNEQNEKGKSSGVVIIRYGEFVQTMGYTQEQERQIRRCQKHL